MNLLIKGNFDEFCKANPEYPVFDVGHFQRVTSKELDNYMVCYVAKAFHPKESSTRQAIVLRWAMNLSRHFGCQFIIIDEGKYPVDKRIREQCFPIRPDRPEISEVLGDASGG